MSDWLGLVIEAERLERPAPATVRSPAVVVTIVRQYQPATADLWRLRGQRDSTPGRLGYGWRRQPTQPPASTGRAA
jgi:hypothetical protein